MIKVEVATSYYWIAPFTNEVGFRVGPAFSSPACASTASYPLQLGRLEQCKWKFLLKEHKY